VSTPGSGGPQPPEHDPAQSGQPAGWQQPPAGQPAPGQPWGQPGAQPGAQPFGTQPGGAQAFGQPGEPQKRKRNWLPIIGGVVALLVVLGVLTTFLGGGDPEVGDCIQQTGASDFETVDCDSDDAEYRIEGTDSDMTGDDFQAAADEDLCQDVPSTTFVLWSGTDESEDGHVYCASDV
jgi:hypothetical protein